MKDILAEAGVENAQREAEWLLETASARSRAEVLVGDHDVADMTERRALKLATRRAAGEPLQYLTGVAGFRHIELAVGPGVFIPRPETESLVDRVLDRLPQGGTVVDVGTGSGAIALAIAIERRDAVVLATESSQRALEWAERNRDALAPGVELFLCDLFDGLPPRLRGEVDVAVSNPPYVASGEAAVLPPDVAEHEPKEALFAGLEGLVVIERLAAAARTWLSPQGWLCLEIGQDQGRKVSSVLTALGYRDVQVSEDRTGRDRVVEARRGDG